MCKVSIIIPTYNNAHLIERAIKSVLGQNFRDFELIVVDDASLDNTKDVVMSFSDDRIRYLCNQKNKGEASSRNEGIHHARGKYIAFLDSDDEAMPGRIQKQVEVLDSSGPEVGIVYTDMWRIDTKLNSKYLSSPGFKSSKELNYKKILGYGAFKIGIGTSMIRRKCFDTVGVFQEGLPYYVDLEFFIRLSKAFAFYHLREPLIKYYEAGPGRKRNIQIRVDSCKFILDKYYDEIKQDNKILARHYRKIATLLIGEDPVRAGKYALKGLKAYPVDLICLIVFMLSFSGKKVCAYLSEQILG